MSRWEHVCRSDSSLVLLENVHLISSRTFLLILLLCWILNLDLMGLSPLNQWNIFIFQEIAKSFRPHQARRRTPLHLQTCFHGSLPYRLFVFPYYRGWSCLRCFMYSKCASYSKANKFSSLNISCLTYFLKWPTQKLKLSHVSLKKKHESQGNNKHYAIINMSKPSF